MQFLSKLVLAFQIQTCTNAIQFQNVGHRSNAAQASKWTSIKQEIQVSDVLYGSKITKKVRKEEKEDSLFKRGKISGRNSAPRNQKTNLNKHQFKICCEFEGVQSSIFC